MTGVGRFPCTLPGGFRVALFLAAGGAAAFAAWTAACAGPAARSRLGLVVLVSGRTGGVLATCGCGSKPTGLAHLATRIALLREQHPGALLLDTGDIGESVPKATAVFDAMREMGYHAAGMQVSDQALGRGLAEAAMARGIPLVGGVVRLNWFALRAKDAPVPDAALVPPDAMLVAVVSGGSWAAGLSDLTRERWRTHRTPDLLVSLGPIQGGCDQFIRSARVAVGRSCGILIADGGPSAREVRADGVLAVAVPGQARGVTMSGPGGRRMDLGCGAGAGNGGTAAQPAGPGGH